MTEANIEASCAVVDDACAHVSVVDASSDHVKGWVEFAEGGFKELSGVRDEWHALIVAT
jgi:hypothetical protein